MHSIIKYFKSKIPAHEKPRISFLWKLRFLYQVGFIFAWTVITSVFLDLFGIQSLPYLLLGDAVLFLLGSLISNLLFIKIDPKNFLIGSIIGTILCIIVSLLFIENTVIFFAAAILAKAFFYYQLHIGILRKNESLFSPGEAQRNMPLIDSAITIGTITAASLFLLLLEIIPTKELLFFWLIPLVVMLRLVIKSPQILAEIPTLHTVTSHHKKNNFKDAFNAVKKTPFLSLMMVIVLVQSTLFMVTEFEFLKSVQEHTVNTEVHFTSNTLESSHLSANLIGDISAKTQEIIKNTANELFVHHSLAHDLGVLSLFFGLVALFVQLVLASKILEKFGLINTMIIHTAGFLGLILSFIFSGTSMNFVRGYQHGFHSLFESAYHLTFYSIFSHRREAVRHFFEGIVRPVGLILGTIITFIIIKTQLFELAWMILGLTIFLLFLIIPIKKEFTLLTRNNLFMDKSLMAKIHSIETLSQKGHSKALQILSQELITSTNIDIQTKIISTLSKIGDSSIIHTYVDILADKSKSKDLKILVLKSLLKIESLRSYWGMHAFSQHHLLKILQTLFKESNNKYIQKLVIMNIFMHLPHHQVVPFFIETINIADDELKSICLRSSSELFSDPEIKYYLEKYLTDKNPRLRGHAVIALASFYAQKKLNKTINDLLEGKTNEEKIAGLYAIGETKNRKFSKHLQKLAEHKSKEIKQHSLIALAKLDDTSSIPKLLKMIFDEDSKQSKSILSMLQRNTSQEFKDILKNEIHLEVSRSVLKVLIKHKITKQEHLRNLSLHLKTKLINLYRLAEKYDHIILFQEKTTIK